jgi:GNAT superfamily N-acetyltransferase
MILNQPQLGSVIHPQGRGQLLVQHAALYTPAMDAPEALNLTEERVGPEVLAVLAEYAAEVLRRCPGDLTPSRVTSNQPREFERPDGAFLVLRLAGEVVACGGLRTIGDGIGELKRMYVRPVVRGRGVGRRVLAALEAVARDLGHEVLRLDTRHELTEARRLYESAGYHLVPAYNDNTDADLWFEKRLWPVPIR